MSRDNLRMVADVGGTNTRIALFDESSGEFQALQTYTNREYARFPDLVLTWMDDLAVRPERGCIAIASPLDGDQVQMVNMDWSFSRRAFAEETGLATLGWINDFVGNAYALPHLAVADRVELHPGGDGLVKKLAAVGPGTGLGGATVQEMAGQWLATACEPGHAGLSPGSLEELAVFEALLGEFDNIYAELLVSGPGLLRLYRTLAAVRDATGSATTPAEVSSAALEQREPLAVDALSMFCGLLGSVCGDFVLSGGAYGGLYLAGGIVPRMIPFLDDSNFHARFCNKGALTPVLEQVPVYAITAEQPGLLGAAHAPIER